VDVKGRAGSDWRGCAFGCDRRDAEGVSIVIPMPSGVRVWIATGHADMRHGMHGLALQVQEQLKRDPHGGDLYIFGGCRSDLTKILRHDGVGLSLYAKRLDRGPSAKEGRFVLAAQMVYMLEGIDWRILNEHGGPKAWAEARGQKRRRSEENYGITRLSGRLESRKLMIPFVAWIPAPESLPDDVAALKAPVVAESARQLKVAAELAVARAKASEEMALIAAQKLQIAKLQRQVLGQRSERSARLVEVLALDLEELEASATEDEPAAARTTTVGAFTRRRVPDHRPCERVAIPTTRPFRLLAKTNRHRMALDLRPRLPVVGDAGPPAAIFHYSRDRRGEHRQAHLTGCAGRPRRQETRRGRRLPNRRRNRNGA
jgi:transposase